VSLSDRVDGAVEGVEALALEAMIDRAGAHAGGQELGPSHHAVLSLRQACDRLVVTTLTFAPYYVVKVRVVAHAAQDCARGVTAG
jgi:hypothetical protein